MASNQDDLENIPDILKPGKEGWFGAFCSPWNKFTKPSLFKVWQWKRAVTESNIPVDKNKLDSILPILAVNISKLKNPPVDKVQVTWIGHATALVQFDGISILSDPVFSEISGPVQLGMLGYRRYRKAACKVKDIPNLDAVIISHNHYDHLDLTSVKDINRRFPNVKWFVASGTKTWFINHGVTKENVVELSWREKHVIKFEGNQKEFNFICTPAQHWCQRKLLDLNSSLWCSWAIKGPKHSYYFAGDTGYHEPLFKKIGEKYGPFDISAIPIGAYLPRWMMKYEHVDPEEAVQIHKDVEAKQSIGIKWGTFELANEFYIEPPFKLAKLMKRETLDERGNPPFTSLCHGETWVVGEERKTPPFMDEQHHPKSNDATSQQSGENSQLDQAEEMLEYTQVVVNDCREGVNGTIGRLEPRNITTSIAHPIEHIRPHRQPTRTKFPSVETTSNGIARIEIDNKATRADANRHTDTETNQIRQYGVWRKESPKEGKGSEVKYTSNLSKLSSSHASEFDVKTKGYRNVTEAKTGGYESKVIKETEKTVDKTESVENATRAYEIYRGAFKTEMRDVKETDRPKTIKQTKDTEVTNVLKTSESSTEKISEDNVKTEVSVKEQSATNETETKAFRPKQPYKLTEAMANSQSGGAVLQPAHTLSHGESEVNVVDNQMSTSLPLNNKSLFQSEVGTEMPKRETSTTIQRNEINSESSVVVTYYDEQSDRIQLDINRDRRQNMLGDISSLENIDEIPTQFRAAEVLVHADEEHMLKKPDQTPLASCQEKHTTTPSEQPKKFTGRSKPLNTNVMPQKLYSQENVDEIPTQFRPAEVLVHADEEQMLKKPDQTPLASCQEKHTTTPSEQPKKFTGRSKPLNTNVKHQKFTGRFKPQLHNEDRHKMPSAERLPISQQHSELPGREHVMESKKNTGYSRKNK